MNVPLKRNLVKTFLWVGNTVETMAKMAKKLENKRTTELSKDVQTYPTSMEQNLRICSLPAFV